MFNRQLEVKVTKPVKAKDVDPAEKTDITEYVQIARELTIEAAKGLAIVVGTYIAADTIRQVVVNRTQK